MVKELRERTQAGMADCKNALVEAGGDIEKAVEVILKKGIVKAASRAGKIATEGEVRTWVSPDAKRGIIVEVNCQTDFVARGDDFRSFVTGVCDMASKAKRGANLETETFPGSGTIPGGKSLGAVRQEMIAKTGENVVVRRWDALEAKGAGAIVHAYIHAGGKLAVLISAEAPNLDAARSEPFKTFVDNCAMQIAAMNPIVIRKEEITEAQIAKQKEIFAGQLKEEGKPEASWPKIIEGKVQKWFTEVTLLGQESVTEPGSTVDKLRQELGKKLGGEIAFHGFVRFGLGDGIEKQQDDLAAEVMKMAGA
jgi:elongation factor Ts